MKLKVAFTIYEKLSKIESSIQTCFMSQVDIVEQEGVLE